MSLDWGPQIKERETTPNLEDLRNILVERMQKHQLHNALLESGASQELLDFVDRTYNSVFTSNEIPCFTWDSIVGTLEDYTPEPDVKPTRHVRRLNKEG